jgi:Protein of unknown function (DUF3352)
MDDEQPPPLDPPAAPAARRGKSIAIAAGIVAAVLVVGGGAAFLLLRGSGEQLLDMVPADADVVVTVYLDPSAGQKVNLLRMADEIPSLGSSEEISERVGDVIDQGLSASGLTHDDLDWIGSQVAISVDLPESGSIDTPVVTALVAADDEAAASSTLTKLREDDPSASGWRAEDHGGVEVWVGSDGTDEVAYGLVNGVVVFTNSAAAIDEVIATSSGERETLAGSAPFQGATAQLPEGKLALIYIDPSQLATAFEGLAADGRISTAIPDSSQDLEAITGVAMSLSAEEDGLALDMQMTFDPGSLPTDVREGLIAPDHENPLLSLVPQDALALISQIGLRTSIAGLVERFDALSSDSPPIDEAVLEALTGDLAIAGMPSGSAGVPSGVLMIGTSDAPATEQAIRSQVDVVVGKPRWQTTDHDGVAVSTLVDRSNSTPFAFSFAVFDGAAVLGASPEAVFEVIDARGSGSSIEDSATYRAAMGAVPTEGGSVYLDIDGLAEAIRRQVPPDQVADFDASVGSTMDHLDAFVMGTESSETTAHVRMFLRVG